MKLETDFTRISDKEATKHPAWSAFVKEMENREYGPPALDTAWYWFKSGWVAQDPTVRKLSNIALHMVGNVLLFDVAMDKIFDEYDAIAMDRKPR